jgi:hypothetical protein
MRADRDEWRTRLARAVKTLGSLELEGDLTPSEQKALQAHLDRLDADYKALTERAGQRR